MALLVEHVGRPLTVLVSTTVAAASPQPALAAMLERLGDAAEVIDLPAMTTDELAEMIAPLAPRVPIARLTAAAELAAGSPYLAELIGRELGDALELADARDAEGRRLARLSANELAVAEVVALAGGTASFEQLRAVGALSAERLQSALRGLEDARVVRATPAITGDAVYALYHQRLRDAAEGHARARRSLRAARRFAVWFHDAESADRGRSPTRAISMTLRRPRCRALATSRRDRARDQVGARRRRRRARAQLALEGLTAECVQPRARARRRSARRARRSRRRAIPQPASSPAAARELLVLAELATAADSANAADLYRLRAAEAARSSARSGAGSRCSDGVLVRRGQPRARTRAGSTVRALWSRGALVAPTRRAAANDPVLAGLRIA